MKKLANLSLLLAVLLYTTNTFGEELGFVKHAATKAKGKSSGGGIEKGLIQMDLSLNLGSNGPVFVGNRFIRGASAGVGFRPGFTFNVDGAVHKYVSVGGYFGIDGGVGFGAGTLGIGFGGRGVFHIYQLIADKANTKVDAGKLDFYMPLHLGGIVYVGTGGSTGSIGGISVGAGLGVRYYFTDRFGVMGELGWNEMTVFKAGLAVKL